MSLVISISPETVFSLGNLDVTNALFSTFIVTLGILTFTFIASRIQLQTMPFGHSLQNSLEIIFDALMGLYESIVGTKKAREFFPFLTTLFFFILFSSWFGLLPGVGPIGVWELHNGEETLIPLFRAPTADLNTTVALAVMGMAFVQWQGLKTLGFHYLGKFFTLKSPIYTLVGLLEFMGEFTKIISFAFRLFGNIFAGEVLLTVMSFLIPFIAPLPFLGLEVFVGIIQSLVFVMLVIVFSSGAMAEHH